MDPELISNLFDFARTPFACLLLAYGRWFTFLSVFAPFNWAKINTGPVRSGIAFILAIPTAEYLLATQADVITSLPTGQLALLLAKEALLGFMLGVLASLPIWVADICGGVLAGIRQDGGSDDKFGSSTFGDTFVMIAIGILIFNGGLLIIFQTVYASYEVWPVFEPVPLFSQQAATVFLSILDLVFGMALIIASPFIASWLLIDIWLGIMQRSANSVTVDHLNDLIKTMLTMALLFFLLQPIIANLVDVTQSLTDFIGIFVTLLEPSK